jgi:hypothetical protein
MKTLGPVKWFGSLEIVPFNADSAAPEISVYLPPGSAYRSPESRFRMNFPWRTQRHLVDIFRRKEVCVNFANVSTALLT